MSLLTDISAGNLYKALKKCKVKRTVRLCNRMFNFADKYNFKNEGNDYIVYINTEIHCHITKENFEQYFTEIQ